MFYNKYYNNSYSEIFRYIQNRREKYMDKIIEKAVLIAVQTKECSENETELSVNELRRLTETAGAEPLISIIQKKDSFDPSTYIGKGKAQELAEICKQNDITLAVTDDEISGSQAKNLSELLGVKVIDRTMLILDIFALRAKSAEGRLQVELAQLKYLMPRLIGFGKTMSRLGGGIGTRGPGETKLETDKRHIRRRIKTLEEKLEKTERERLLSRKRRSKNGVATVALVGYTNAGKSSVMNKLCCSDEVYVEDKLFATLDSTTRKMVFSEFSQRPVLLTDTVGFIRKLPHALIEAFKSTLEEATSAQLLLHVIDSADEALSSHIEIVNKILLELGINLNNVWMVMNKSDKICENNRASYEAVFASYKNNGEEILEISTKTNEGMENLRNKIKEYFEKNTQKNFNRPEKDR